LLGEGFRPPQGRRSPGLRPSPEAWECAIEDRTVRPAARARSRPACPFGHPGRLDGLIELGRHRLRELPGPVVQGSGPPASGPPRNSSEYGRSWDTRPAWSCRRTWTDDRPATAADALLGDAERAVGRVVMADVAELVAVGRGPRWCLPYPMAAGDDHPPCVGCQGSPPAAGAGCGTPASTADNARPAWSTRGRRSRQSRPVASAWFSASRAATSSWSRLRTCPDRVLLRSSGRARASSSQRRG
jgi:hypothetical protein